MTRPIVATSSWVSEEQHAAAVKFASGTNGADFQAAGVTWIAEVFRCCERAFYYAPMPSDGRVGLVHTVPKCPVCDPIGSILDDHDVARRDAELVRLAKRLVDTSAVHSMLVLLDDAQRRGLTDGTPSEGSKVTRLRNPADVLEIDALQRKRGAELIACAFEAEHAAIGTVAAVQEWSRAPLRLLRELAASPVRPAFECMLGARLARALGPYEPYEPARIIRFVSERVRMPLPFDTRTDTSVLWVQEGFETSAEGFLDSLTRAR